ncbi:Pentatricopeptide repeat-containing protein [Hordeum vulgare]|nr:Pentatricopeptide repeat-containing protein [Hordeum vulgare]
MSTLDRHGELGQGGGAAKGAGQGKGLGVALEGDNVAPRLEAIPMPPRLNEALPARAAGVQAQGEHQMLMEGYGPANERTVTLDQGWATFSSIHRIKIDYMATLKFLTSDTLKVIVFNDDGNEVATKCGRHDDAFAVNV